MRNLIFVISILSLSLLNAQSLDEKITNLNKAKTFLGQSETQNYVSILDSVRKIIYLSDEIEKLFNNAEQNIQNNYKKLLNAEEQQRSTSSKSVHEVAIGRTIIVEGIIEDIIVSSDKAKVSVLLSDNVRCTLKNKSDIKDADQNAKVLIKGKVFSHENSSSILEDCIFFRKKDFSEQYAQAKKLLQKFVNDCLGIIDIELKQGNELLVTNLISEASREYLSNKFENALDLYLKIESIDPQFPKIQDHLLNSKMNLEYQKAAESLNNNEFFEAYILLEPLAFEYNFKNSKELYLKAFTKNYSQLITNSINRNNISTYISVFDTLNAKNKKYIDLCFDSLSAAWIKEFKNFAYAYYINNYSSYYVVPGGNYSKYHGQLIEINTFIINPNEIDQTLLHSYNLTHANKISQNTDKEYSKVAKWLGLSLLTQREIDYIKCGGWKSNEERVYYTDDESSYITSKKINLDVNKYLFLFLDDLNDESLKEKYEHKANEIDELIKKNIVLKKEHAYLTKRVEKQYQNNIIPSLSALWGWENYSDFQTPNLQNSSLAIEHSGFGGSLSYGMVIKHGKSDSSYRADLNKHMLNLFASYYHVTNAVFADSAARKQNSVREYKFTSLEFGIGYSRMLRGSGLLSLGYSASVGFAIANKQFNIIDSNDLELLSYSAHNNSIFIELGLSFMFNFKIKGYYPLKRNDFGNNFRGEFLIELAYPIWFNLVDPFD